MKSLGTQRGFTLIELVVVILILGILAATALPRYIDAQVDARKAKAQAIFGSVRAAMALAKARCELDVGQAGSTSTCNTATGTISMEGATVDTVYAYPAGSATGIQVAAQLNATADSVTITAGGGTVTITVNGATTPASCGVSYVQAAAVGGSPTVTLTGGTPLSGC